MNRYCFTLSGNDCELRFQVKQLTRGSTRIKTRAGSSDGVKLWWRLNLVNRHPLCKLESNEFMRLIGYWIRSLWDEEFPPPQEIVTKYDPSLRKCINDYLEAGRLFRSYRGLSWCRVCNIHLGSIELSDGQWVWPGGLSHYVRCHNVRLPNDFIATVKAGGPAAPHPEDEWSTLGYDETFWIAWCHSHRSGSLASKFSIVRKLATEQAAIFHAFAIKERERKEGISDCVCQRSGCSNPALLDRALCAAWIHKSDVELRFTGEYTNLMQVLNAKPNIDTQLVLFP